jgi:hypothetical protein
MKLALTLVITAVFVPCMQAFDRGSQQENDVLGKWLKQHIYCYISWLLCFLFNAVFELRQYTIM